MQKRGLSGIITTILLILLVLIAIGIIWLFIRPAITDVVGDQSSDGEISRLTSCLDIKLDSNCEILENGNYQIKIRRSADESNIKGIVFRFKTDNEEFTSKNETLIPDQFGSARYTFNLSSETSEEVRTVEVATILENGNACSFQSLSSCSQQTIEGNGNQNFEPLATYALSWEGTPELNDNVIPMFQLRVQYGPDDALQRTSQQPEGYKSIIDRSRYLGINTNESDKCQDPVTLNYSDCIWWDNGVEATKEKYENFLSQYNASGGKLDYWILDTETWLSNWAIGSNLGNQQQLERWRAIQNDPRNATLFQELQARGFQGEDLIGTVYNWSKGGDNYLIWNSYMLERVSDYYDEAIYSVVQQYYPEVIASNYGFNYWSSEYPVPETNGHKNYKYGTGTHFGTHQAPGGLYGVLGQISNINRLLQGFTYHKTPFNAFRYELNFMRSMKLSSSIPVHPWISHKGWNKSLIYDNNYYEEMILHITLTNPDNFLYWNPSTGDSPSNEGNDTLLSNLLMESDSFVGYKNRQIITYDYIPYTNETWWMSDYVLSGMKASDKKVWRFTPNVLNSTYTQTESESGIVFTTQSYNITIPEGTIEQNQYSTIGYWVTQPEISPNPIIVQL